MRHQLFKRTDQLAMCLAVAVGVLPALAESHPRIGSWDASRVVGEAELIAVLRGPGEAAYFDTPEGMYDAEGTLSILRFTVIDVLLGDVEKETDILLVQPPGPMHGFAHILDGESLLFLKRLSVEDRNRIEQQSHLFPTWDDDLLDNMWTFVESRQQWMNWVQFTHIVDGQSVAKLGSPLVTQLERVANVEKRETAVLNYMRELAALRIAAVAGAQLPSEDLLDHFQKEVVRAGRAIREGREPSDGDPP